VPSQNFSWGTIEYVEVEATLHVYLREADGLCFLLQVYVIYVEASSSWCSEHFWQDRPICRWNNRILCNPFPVPSEWQFT